MWIYHSSTYLMYIDAGFNGFKEPTPPSAVLGKLGSEVRLIFEEYQFHILKDSDVNSFILYLQVLPGLQTHLTYAQPMHTNEQ